MVDANSSSTLEALQKEYQALIHGSSAQNTKPRVAAWGLVKAGKSSLLNMLSGHVTDEYFETGDVRTTRVNQELETDHYILLDTPGLGIDDEDTQEAYKGLDSADVILFVHAPQGELDQEEIRFLDQICLEYGAEADRRLIIVLTQLDKNKDQALEKIRDRVLDQIEKGFGIMPQCFLLSNTRYQKGAAENKQTLIKKSGIPELAEHLETLVEDIQPDQEQLRAQRAQAKKDELLDRLGQAMASEQARMLEIKKIYQKKVVRFNKIMQNLRDEYQHTEKAIARAQRELENI
ncbi:MAG: GTPase [Castellaniella sp.]|uniref:GTPase n=1 Tax=Castellaniella hirudinis TaxID=1144617 RepID=A0ABV8S3K1_9BURK